MNRYSIQMTGVSVIQYYSPLIFQSIGIDTSTTLLGRALPHPILLAPAAAHMLVHPEGEVATARGAGAASAIMVLSANANCAVETVVAAATQPLWFQLYVDRARHKTEALLHRLKSMPQIKALFVTVDLAVVSKREADERRLVAPQAPPRLAPEPAARRLQLERPLLDLGEAHARTLGADGGAAARGRAPTGAAVTRA